MRILLGHLYQDFVGPLVQDLCLRIPVSRPLWTTCIGILLDHLYHHAVGPLVQHLCFRILFDHFYQDAVGLLVQGLCIRIFWTARIKIQDRVGPLLQDLCIRIQICIGILSDHLHQSPIVSDHLCKISVSGSFRTTCIGFHTLFRIL